MLLVFKTSPKASLVLILVLMQLIAPLVHGHAGYGGQQDGLHIHFGDAESHSSAVETKGMSTYSSAYIENIAVTSVDISTGVHRKVYSHMALMVVIFGLLLIFGQIKLEKRSLDKLIKIFSAFKLSPPERAPPVTI